jgi:hypothetical protein
VSQSGRSGVGAAARGAFRSHLSVPGWAARQFWMVQPARGDPAAAASGNSRARETRSSCSDIAFDRGLETLLYLARRPAHASARLKLTVAGEPVYTYGWYLVDPEHRLQTRQAAIRTSRGSDQHSADLRSPFNSRHSTLLIQRAETFCLSVWKLSPLAACQLLLLVHSGESFMAKPGWIEPVDRLEAYRRVLAPSEWSSGGGNARGGAAGGREFHLGKSRAAVRG